MQAKEIQEKFLRMNGTKYASTGPRELEEKETRKYQGEGERRLSSMNKQLLNDPRVFLRLTATPV